MQRVNDRSLCNRPAFGRVLHLALLGVIACSACGKSGSSEGGERSGSEGVADMGGSPSAAGVGGSAASAGTLQAAGDTQGGGAGAGSAVAGQASGAGAPSSAGAANGANGGSAGVGGAVAGGFSTPAATRADAVIDGGWRFLRQDQAGASASTFDDASWSAVTLPHSWNATDGQNGGGDYYRGIGWYRKHYVLPAGVAGKKVYLQFDGASMIADVFVNGMSLGQHRGGFSRFRFDVTAAMTAGDNVIAVKVSNAPVTDVAPLEADFTFFGGLYRDVHVLITDALHVDTQDYASSGVYLDTTEVSSTSAKLRARVRVQNGRAAAAAVTVKTTLVRADGSVEATLSTTGRVPPGMTAELSATATVMKPHLWNGKADPYVYTAYSEVSESGSVTDWVSAPLGFRSYVVDAAQGFSLNGQYLDLHGVNRHQDRIDKGWAISDKEHEEDLALITEMGANIVRLSHYEQAEHFHDLADREGLVLWAEIPLVNAIGSSAAFGTNAAQQLTELIRQNYNHPSIFFWGIGNEQRSDNAATNALLTTLNTLVHTEDPTRLSTYAHCCTSDTGGLPAHSDVVGYNEYFGWYAAFGTAEQFGAWADNLHALKPTWKLGVSEYGAGAALSQHQDPPVAPDPYGALHPEEWQNVVHELHWKQMATRRYLWSKIVWNMFDFAVDSRAEGDTPGRNDKGLVSYDRKTRKDAFFWYKANWTTTPVVYISSRRFRARTTPTVTVKVYSNLASVSLKVNGTLLGAKSSTDHIFQWLSVPLANGDNTVEATASGPGAPVVDTVTWTRM